MPRHATSTSFKKGQVSPAKGIKRPDLALRNKLQPTKGRKGRESSPEFKEKVRLGVLQAYREGRLTPMQGELNPQYGKPTTEKQKNSARELFKRLNKDPEFIKRRLKALCRKPTYPEQQLINWIAQYKLPYRYVGDGSFLIGNLNPDFVNVNGAKKVIEMFGTYWHDIFDIAKRTQHFRQYGFDTLIIWEDELTNEEAIISKIKNFERRK